MKNFTFLDYSLFLFLFWTFLKMPYNYNNTIQNFLANDSNDIRMKHFIKEACKEIMKKFASRHSCLTLNKVMSVSEGLL